MNSDKLHHPQRPPQNKNTSRVKKLGEVGLDGLPHCIKKPAPLHSDKLAQINIYRETA